MLIAGIVSHHIPMFIWSKNLRRGSLIHNDCMAIPVVPHKAVAEVSKIGNLYIGEIGCCESGMAERIH